MHSISLNFRSSKFFILVIKALLSCCGIFFLSSCGEKDKVECWFYQVRETNGGSYLFDGTTRNSFGVEQCFYDKEVTAVPDVGYRFVRWVIEYDGLQQGDIFNATILLVAEGTFSRTNYKELRAIFEPVANDSPEGDLDGDGISNADDPDDDNDGVTDEVEIANGTDPNDPEDTPDLVPPVITLVGPSTLELTLSQVASLSLDSASDGYATATDNVDGDITSSITISTTLDITQAGTYEIIYSVSDQAGNSATVTRTVILTEDIAIYFEDGICKCPEANVGQSKTIDGVTYTVVDNNTIVNEISNENYNLCTTAVTVMSEEIVEGPVVARNLFNSSEFNSDISFWDTSNVTNTYRMFYGAVNFNQDISNWDMSNVVDMARMFQDAESFNQDISNWNVSSLRDMYATFSGAQAFDQPLGSWDVSNVYGMDNIFNGASSFNQDLTNWCVTNFTTEPLDFATNSSLTEANKPIWGTCPSD